MRILWLKRGLNQRSYFPHVSGRNGLSRESTAPLPQVQFQKRQPRFIQYRVKFNEPTIKIHAYVNYPYCPDITFSMMSRPGGVMSWRHNFSSSFLRRLRAWRWLVLRLVSGCCVCPGASCARTGHTWEGFEEGWFVGFGVVDTCTNVLCWGHIDWYSIPIYQNGLIPYTVRGFEDTG